MRGRVPTKPRASAALSRISKRAERSLLERIDRLAVGCRSDEGFEAASVRNVDRLGKQALDELRQTDIAPQAHRSDLHENVDVAVGAVIAPRARAKHRGVAHAAFAQGGLMFTKPGEDGGFVHGPVIALGGGDVQAPWRGAQ